jgi:SHS family lactate transporter-like MFS transporter
MGDDHSGHNRRVRDATLFVDGFLRHRGRRLHCAGCFPGAIYGQNPCYLSERFPTEVRATASGFCYHQGAIWAGFTGPVLTYFAASQPLGFTVPMLIATSGAAVVFVVTLLFSPETRGKELVPQLTLVAESSAA